MTTDQHDEPQSSVREAFMHAGMYGYAIGEFALIKVLIDYKAFDNIPEEGSIPISTLATKIGGEQEILDRFVLQLCMAGVLVSPQPGHVAHTEKSKLYKTGRNEARLMCHVFDMLFRPLAQLPTFFKQHGLASPRDSSVTPFGLAFGHPDWDVYKVLENDSALYTQFNGVLKGIGKMYSLKGVYDFEWLQVSLSEKRPAIVDIGGSSGLALKDILANNPSIPASQCALFDLPPVTEYTEKTCEGNLKSIQFVGGSIFEPLPASLHGANVYHLQRILNDFTDNDVLRTLKTIRAAAAPDSRIIVVEEMLSTDRNILNVGMDIFLMLVGGKKRNAAMFSDLAVRAGWRLNGEFQSASKEYDDFTVLEFVLA